METKEQEREKVLAPVRPPRREQEMEMPTREFEGGWRELRQLRESPRRWRVRG